jgi:tight adherence protein B
MVQILILALVFLGTIGILVGGYAYANRRSLATSQTALERLRDVERVTIASARSILRQDSVSDLPFFDRLLAGRNLTNLLTQQLQVAGIVMTPGSFLLRLIIAALTGIILGRFISAALITPVLGACIGTAIPLLWLRSKTRKRLEGFQKQLPDAIDMMTSSMKAGYSFQAAMKFIGEEVPEPLGPEFARFYEEQRLGMDVRTALMGLQERIDSLDLKMFVTAVLIQRETGGNLAEVLEKISSLMRERAAIKGEIQTLTAESKLSARILGALPFVVFAAVNLLNPGFMKPMLESNSGPWIMFGAGLSVAFGYWIMMRIADVDI